MAKLANTTIEEIRELDGPGLLAQQILQHGAIHALEHLLTIGPTRENVESMLAGLRGVLAVVEDLAEAKKVKLSIDHEHSRPYHSDECEAGVNPGKDDQ